MTTEHMSEDLTAELVETNPRVIAAELANALVATGQLDVDYWEAHAERVRAFLESSATTDEPSSTAQNARALTDLLAHLETGGYAVVEDAAHAPKIVRREVVGLRVSAFLALPITSLDYPVRILALRERNTSPTVRP